MSASAREVRKTVTILFCDLVRSSGLAEGDPEAYRRIQSRYFEQMRSIIERYGGTVEKFIGDEVMAVFGVPAVHEDDALRAVRAAREMRAALPLLGLEGRIGVNTGEVLAGDPGQGQAFVAGEPVIVAKRLEQAAEPGEILIGRATYPLVAHAAEAGPLERIPVKGKQEQVGKRRLGEVDLEAPGVARRLHAPIVGRAQELELLHQAFERAVSEQACRLFTVLGPAGIGKSRLATELIASLRSRARSAVGRCLPYGEGITFWPLTDLLEGLGGEEAVGAAFGEDEQREVVLGLLRGVTGGSAAGGSSEETFWAVRRAFETLARQRPLLLCFEDLHWAEPTLLDLIEYVVGWSRDAPILVLVLARPELVEQRPTWIAPQPNSDAIALEPLSGAATESLLVGLSGEIELLPEVRERIAAAAEGNPLFVEQMAAMADEQNGGALQIPPSIQALLAERLDRLTEEERELIERASVVGRDFSVAQVAALSTDERPALFTGHLLALARKGLIQPDPSAPSGEDSFRFHHVLVRDSAYEAMPKARRAVLHERLADWAEQSGSTREPEALVGYHLEQAYRAWIDIGARDERTERLARRAGKLLGFAGRRALARDDVPGSSNLLERAAGLLTFTHDPSSLSEVQLELGFALRGAGDLARAEAILADATASAGEGSRDDIRLRALLERSSLRSFVDPQAKSEEMLRVAGEAIEFFEATDDDLGLTRALLHVAEAHWLRCRLAETEEVLERALIHAERAGALHDVASILGAMVRSAVVGPPPVEDAIRRCLELSRREPRIPATQARTTSALAVLEAMRGHFAEARRLYTSTKTALEDMGHRLLVASLQMYAGIAELIAGENETAERELRLGYDQLEEMGEHGYLSTQAALLSKAQYSLGRYDDAEEATLVSEQSASPDDVATHMIWRGTRAKLLARRADPAAEALAREAVVLSRATDYTNWQADALVDLAETLRLLGRSAELEPVLDEALALYAAKGNVASAAAVRQTYAFTSRREDP